MNRDTSTVISWRTSSYSSDTGGQCVEVGWHISSHSPDGGRSCVEAGPFLDEPQRFAVRDSTQRDLGYLSFPSPEWSALLRVSSS
ncbi:DUF397 domain-containing protein [Nocardiopsis sp. L17-MgMaSL7]|uniref:DUF397 domain-containing protein n=1 Tax=Nocardiopsis sp. L17-MgMaSL7 TaxID=1938893 RepID=UPI000D7115F1|nr:DUF397 domain-containing protein [Nocardiopsis sp. L17-MgMaSL7]PWV47267.1 uncharacterized protein DUF397 [Nocardiopsis sp. L17-MgMaSL7]